MLDHPTRVRTMATTPTQRVGGPEDEATLKEGEAIRGGSDCRRTRRVGEEVERTGFEPATSSLQSWHSTS